MDITKHALQRLKDRFDLDHSHITNIKSILNNKHSYTHMSHKRGAKELKFKYRGVYMVAVIKDCSIVTFKYTDIDYLQKQKEKSMNELSTEKVMTVQQVSEIMGKDPSTIRKIGKGLFPESFKHGVITYLNEKQVTAIKLNLGKNSSLPKTDLEKELIIQQAISFQQEKISILQSRIEEMEPKAEFFDQVTNSKDAVDMGSASKVLNMGIGRNKLFELLRNKNILMSNNQPYQKYIDNGYFRTIEQKFTKPDGSTSINIKTVVYQKGLNKIRKIVETTN